MPILVMYNYAEYNYDFRKQEAEKIVISEEFVIKFLFRVNEHRYGSY